MDVTLWTHVVRLPWVPRSDEEGRIRLWSVHVASYDAGYVSLIAL